MIKLVRSNLVVNLSSQFNAMSASVNKDSKAQHNDGVINKENGTSVKSKWKYNALWDKWASDNSRGNGELKDMAVARLKYAMDNQLDTVDLSDLNLTSLPEFSPNLQSVNVANNPLSKETINLLQKNAANPDYHGPEIIFTAGSSACEESLSAGDFRKHLIMVYGFYQTTHEYMRDQEHDRLMASHLVDAVGIKGTIMKYEKFTFNENMVKELLSWRKEMPEDIAKQTLVSFINFLNDNLERLDMSKLIARKQGKYADNNYTFTKNTFGKHAVDGNLKDEKLINGIDRGEFDIKDRLTLRDTFETMLFRVTSKLVLDWAQKEQVKVEFIIQDEFSEEANDWTKEEIYSQVEQHSKEKYKPITFSEISHIKRKNLDVVEFKPLYEDD